MGKRTQNYLVRYFQLLECLQSRTRGWTVRQLSERLEASTQTIYRDLKLLRESSLPLRKEMVNGETRYSLATLNSHQMSISPDVLAVLWLARQELSALEGTGPIKALDDLLKKIGVQANRNPIALTMEKVHPTSEKVLPKIEEAIRKGRQLMFKYQGAKDTEAQIAQYNWCTFFEGESPGLGQMRSSKSG
ncbi:MAG: HTH domain-containing protein [Deltaproteobacteria bacterium]|nr:HTH domain-containing protein [Deltaproteobacteria bacterium]